MVLQVMVEVVLVLGKSTSPPKIYILEEKGIMGGFRRLRGFFGVASGGGKDGVCPRIIHITTKKFGCWIDGSNFFHQVVGIIHPCVIHAKKGTIIHQNL